MTKIDKRKTVIHLIEKDAIFNTRVMSEILAKKIKNGGINL